MPPASLSTFAVMNPGPTTARKSRIRVFERLKNVMGNLRAHMDGTDSGYKRRHRINAVRESGQRKSEPPLKMSAIARRWAWVLACLSGAGAAGKRPGPSRG